MEQILASYMTRLEEHCLLSPISRALYSYLLLLLDHVAHFCLIHQRQHSSIDSEEKMTEVYRSFLRHFTHVNALLDHLVNSRLAPFVEDLRLRLDFNGFFRRAYNLSTR